MKIVSIQNKNLEFDKDGVCYHNGACNYSENKEAYDKMFQEYNQRNCTKYNNLFWGFSKLLERDYTNGYEYIPIELSKRVFAAIYNKLGLFYEECDNSDAAFYLMDIPDELILESDFYNFTDYIYMTRGFEPDFKVLWETIFSDRDETKQVVFPYIKKEWIIEKIDTVDVGMYKPNRFTEEDFKSFLNTRKPDMYIGDVINFPINKVYTDIKILDISNNAVFTTLESSFCDRFNKDGVPVFQFSRNNKEEEK